MRAVSARMPRAAAAGRAGGPAAIMRPVSTALAGDEVPFVEQSDDWRRLAEVARTPFATWEWAAAWWRHMGTGREPLVEAVRGDGGEVTAILPLCIAREGGARVARFVGHGPADELGPVCAPSDMEGAAESLRRLLRRESARWDVFTGDNMPAAGAWGDRLEARVRQRESSPVIELGGRGFEAFLAARSRNFRDQVRRRERKLGREHELRFRLSGTHEELRKDLDTLVELHDARWQGASDAFAGPRREFHHDFAARALDRGWLRLWTAELDGRPAAAWYGLRYAGDEWFYQSGRDPALERTGVGFVLLAHTVREAADDGVGHYRLLRGDEPYKWRWATGDDPVETVEIARGLRGRVLAGGRTARAAAGRMRQRLRRSTD